MKNGWKWDADQGMWTRQNVGAFYSTRPRIVDVAAHSPCVDAFLSVFRIGNTRKRATDVDVKQALRAFGMVGAIETNVGDTGPGATHQRFFHKVKKA